MKEVSVGIIKCIWEDNRIIKKIDCGEFSGDTYDYEDDYLSTLNFSIKINESCDNPKFIVEALNDILCDCYSGRVLEIEVDPKNKYFEIPKGSHCLVYKPTKSLCLVEDGPDYEIPNDIEIIEKYSFVNSRRYKPLHIPASVKTIKCGAFFKAKIKQLYLDGNVENCNSAFGRFKRIGIVVAGYTDPECFHSNYMKFAAMLGFGKAYVDGKYDSKLLSKYIEMSKEVVHFKKIKFHPNTRKFLEDFDIIPSSTKKVSNTLNNGFNKVEPKTVTALFTDRKVKVRCNTDLDVEIGDIVYIDSIYPNTPGIVSDIKRKRYPSCFVSVLRAERCKK